MMMTSIHKKLNVSVVWVLFLFTLSACSQATSQTISETSPTPLPLPTITAKNYPRLDGSTSTTPLGMLIFCELMGVPCEWAEWIDGTKMPFPDVGDLEITDDEFPGLGHHGTHDAYLNLISGEADLIFVARLPSADELEAAAALDVRLISEAIALDAFVFILNIENPVDTLRLQQIQEIYMGHIADWHKVGGWDADITPYQRNDNSGSQELMKALVMKDMPMIHAPEMMLPSMLAPINAISSDPNGIGYSVYYYEQYMAPNQELKLCGVDGVIPNFETIQAREYPFTTEVYAVMRADLSTESVAYRLRDWVLSSEGQAVVAESGYVPLE
jgi:phosphate transport system substrate-binding protein